MKYGLVILSMLMALSAQAIDFRCVNKNKVQALLSMDVTGRNIRWMQAGVKPSSGIYKGVEKAPFSDWKGYHLFMLRDWAYSNDSLWLLAIDNPKSSAPKVVVFYDNDDHYERENYFQCYR